MRQIGTLADERQARALADYLLTQDITTRLDPGPDGVAVWVHAEDQVERARRALAEFRADPDHPRYQDAAGEARARRQEHSRREREFRRNYVEMADRWSGPSARRRPLTVGLIAVCILVALLTNLGSRASALTRALAFSSSHIEVLPSAEGAFGARAVLVDEGLAGIRRGEVWRLLTPIFLHFSPLHILFNLMMLNSIGSLLEPRLGSRTLLMLVLVTGLTSNIGEYVYETAATGESHLFGGMSGVLYGLFGYVWLRGEFDPAGLGFRLTSSTVTTMLGWLVLCMTGLLGPIANAAHVVGLVAGLLIALATHSSRRLGRH